MLSKQKDDTADTRLWVRILQIKQMESQDWLHILSPSIYFLSILCYNLHIVIETYLFLFPEALVAVILSLAYLPWYRLKVRQIWAIYFIWHTVYGTQIQQNTNISPTNNTIFEAYRTIVQWKQFLTLVDYFSTF